MHCSEHPTDLKLQSSLPKGALVWLGITLFFTSLYVIRASMDVIPPEDHIALSLILCFLLSQLLMNVEQTVLKISLPYNRAWLQHHRFGRRDERSLPVSQIHSARVEYSDTPQNGTPDCARIVLITALGMIPVNEKYQTNPVQLGKNCQQINSFLESQKLFFEA